MILFLSLETKLIEDLINWKANLRKSLILQLGQLRMQLSRVEEDRGREVSIFLFLARVVPKENTAGER